LQSLLPRLTTQNLLALRLQALRNPRPDFSEFPQERALILPVLGVSAGGTVGYVKIVIS
jgi:hypothetical protein